MKKKDAEAAAARLLIRANSESNKSPRSLRVEPLKDDVASEKLKAQISALETKLKSADSENLRLETKLTSADIEKSQISEELEIKLKSADSIRVEANEAIEAMRREKEDHAREVKAAFDAKLAESVAKVRNQVKQELGAAAEVMRELTAAAEQGEANASKAG